MISIKKAMLMMILTLFVLSIAAAGFAAPTEVPVTSIDKEATEEVSPPVLQPDEATPKAPDKPALKKPTRKPFTVVTIVISETPTKDWEFGIPDAYKKLIPLFEDSNIKVVPYKTLSPLLKVMVAADFFKPAAVLSLAKKVDADYAVVVYDRAAPFTQKDVTWISECLVYNVADGEVILDNADVRTFWKGSIRGHYNDFVRTMLGNWAQAVKPVFTELLKL